MSAPCSCAIADRSAIGGERAGGDDPGCVDRKDRRRPPALDERLHGVEHGLVLDGARDDVTPARRAIEKFGRLCRAAQREVVGLGAAAGEHDLGRLGPDQLCDRRARLVQHRLGALAEVMHARRVAEVFAQRARHGLDDRRVRRCGRVVIEVGPGHSHISRFPNSSIFP